MKFVSFERAGQASYGLLRGEDIIDLGVRLRAQAPTLKDLIASGRLQAVGAEHADTPADLHLADVELLPVIPHPATIACVGHNYEAHRVETQRPPTEHPSIFFRCPESLLGAGRPLVRPRETEQLDFEGELAVVIGRGGRRIAQEQAWAHIAGVACFNEGSVRDWQYHTSQFGPGKNFPGTGAFGPCLVTLDELPANRVVSLTTRVNGEVMQQAATDQMIFSIPRVVAYLSTFMTLQPGDVIVTGTPGGVGVKRKPPVFLQPGDVVEVEISSVGLLRNCIVQED